MALQGLKDGKRLRPSYIKSIWQKYAREYPGKLSGGQQQLIAIARAIVTEPKVVTYGRTVIEHRCKLREDIRQEIRRIQQETQITTVYVTHDQEDAFLLADNMAVMNAGMLEQIGSPEEIYSSPTSLFVANFCRRSKYYAGKIDGERQGIDTMGWISM